MRYASLTAPYCHDIANYSELRAALAQALATEVEFVPVDDQISGAVLLKDGQIDLALVGPSEYVVIQARTNAVSVIGITRPNYRSVLATRAESEVKAIADLKSKTLALSDVGSTSGHLGPIAMLVEAGLDPQQDLTVEMLGDDGSTAALRSGQVEAWGGSFTDYEDMSQAAPEQFVILQRGPLLPSDVLIAGSHIAADVVTAIQAKMLANEAALTTAIATHERKYEGSTLTVMQDQDYDSIRAAYSAIGQGNFLN
ncbi:phosphate/phosphite/phosphonate ABC transporter substrate-binding protein [Spirulina major]|uniref:phosphate/phosphite/phosphonate ABC transporter substrate-binding protein n=1 Tax=Spirulina major TaxID=270636 RepID=UPI001587AD2A|nr:PhnD/SsuA/transferrin family substrate-binding protein [Spirulina major]